MKTKLGMRIIKTGIGIYVSLLFCDLLGFENGSLAAITTVVGLQPSLQDSLKTIKNQILATIIGCTFAIIITYFFPGHALPIAISAIITIWICIRLGWQDSISLAVVTLILIAENPGDNYLLAISNRVTMIIIGLSVAFSLNFTLPPKYMPRLRAKLDELRRAYEDLYIKIIDDLISGYSMGNEKRDKQRENIKNLLEESWAIYDLTIDSNIKYISNYQEDDRKDIYHLFHRTITTIENNLERIMEIHYNIDAILEREQHPEISEKTHNYLYQIYIYHQEAFQYILSDPGEDNLTERDFEQIKQELLTILDEALIDSPNYLEPFNYYAVLMEGERIISEIQLLVEEKRGGRDRNRKGDS